MLQWLRPIRSARIKRVLHGSLRHRIALMCAERDPRLPSRALLVGRA